MSRQRFGLAVTLMLLGGVQAASGKSAFCSLQYVTLAGSDVQLHFVPDSGLFVRVEKAGHGVSWSDRMYRQVGGGMHRLYPNRLEPEPNVSLVFLGEDEEAFVGGDPHSSCTLRVTRSGNEFGVTMAAHVGLPGLPPQSTTRFLPVIN